MSLLHRISFACAVFVLSTAIALSLAQEVSPALRSPLRPIVPAAAAPEAAPAAATEAPATNETAPPVPQEIPPEMLVEAKAPPVESWRDAQIELSRRGFSCGSIDGVVGPKTRAALRAFQLSQDLRPTAELDADTRAQLTLSAPAFTQASLSEQDLASLQPLSKTWLGKSEQPGLSYETALEAIAERFHAHPGFIRQLNPSLDWDAITPETRITVPAVERVTTPTKAARLQINLTNCVLQAFDAAGRVMAHFPVSIGSTAEKRPAGELHVVTAAADPNYTFDPAVFPESPEARELREQGKKLILPPGPNNPVGVAWIGLDRPGFGIHGTPSPERVGRAESHGCFRLANWDARTLLQIVRIGMPVQIEP